MWHDLIGSDLDQEAFAEFLHKTATGVTEAVVIYAPTPEGVIPVALGSYIERVVWIEPHIDFFPWASDRNKIEASIKYVLEARKTKPLFMVVERQHQQWMDHILKYGVIGRSGTHNPTNRVLYESGEKNGRHS